MVKQAEGGSGTWMKCGFGILVGRLIEPCLAALWLRGVCWRKCGFLSG